MVDESASRNAWPLGCILEVQQSKRDGLVRSVLVKTSSTVLQRQITKIVLLETIERAEEDRFEKD